MINKVLRDLGCDDLLDQKAAGTITNHEPFITTKPPMDPRNFAVNSNMRMNNSLHASSRHQDRSVEFPLANASTTPIPSLSSGNGTKRSLYDFNDDSKDFSAWESALKKPFVPNAEDYKNESSSDSRFRCYQTEQWSDAFQALLDFRKAHGHCLVPHAHKENMSLARWVKRQRYQNKLLKEGKPSTMTEERIKLLDNVGFVWDSHHSTWEERVAELCQYKKRIGHCNVPSSYKVDIRLATWVKCQRRQYKLFWQGKTCNTTLDRMNQLQEMGFEWTVRNKNVP
jgi:hypothetical protein